MLPEIDSAVEFMCQEILHAQQATSVTGTDWAAFKEHLKQELCRRYAQHWFPEEPARGCAYRCIHCSPCSIDQCLEDAASSTGAPAAAFLAHAPECFHLWIDPGEVSAKLTADGNIVTIYNASNGNGASNPSNHGTASTISTSTSTSTSTSSSSSSPLRHMAAVPTVALSSSPQSQHVPLQTLFFTNPAVATTGAGSMATAAAGAAFRTASPPSFDMALPMTTTAQASSSLTTTAVFHHQQQQQQQQQQQRLPAVTAPSYHPQQHQHQHHQHHHTSNFHQHHIHNGHRHFRPAVQVHH